MWIYNMIYIDATASVTTADRRLHVDAQEARELIECGVEVRGINERGVEYAGYVHNQKRRQRKTRIGSGPQFPTRVATVIVTAPDGKEYRATNLKRFVREHFGQNAHTAYVAFIQKCRWRGWTMQRVSVDAMTIKQYKDAIE